MRLPFDGQYPISQEFGLNPQLYSRFQVKQPDGSMAAMKGHNGMDWACPTGTVIKAPHSGRVIEATYDQDGYGYYVKLENDKEGSVLAHLDSIKVQVGYFLAEGDIIGTSDNTGYSTGAHLHWGYYVLPRNRANGYSGFQDQRPELELAGVLKPLVVSTSDEIKEYTQIEYEAAMSDREKFWKERDEARAEVVGLSESLKSAEKKLELANKQNDSFVAEHNQLVIDYSRLQKQVDDMIAIKPTNRVDCKEQELTIAGLQEQLSQALRRNETLALELANKEKEDYTAIEIGIKAVKELKGLKTYPDKIMDPDSFISGIKNAVGKIIEVRQVARNKSRKVIADEIHKLFGL